MMPNFTILLLQMHLSGVSFQSSYSMDCLNYVVYVIVVCLALNLTARFRFQGVQYHGQKHIFLYQITQEKHLLILDDFQAFEQISMRI